MPARKVNILPDIDWQIKVLMKRLKYNRDTVINDLLSMGLNTVHAEAEKWRAIRSDENEK